MTGQTQGTRNPERDARFAALYRDGAYTLEDIALEEALRSGGKPLTRERVRQIVRRAGVTPEESNEAKKRARQCTLTCHNPACGKAFERPGWKGEAGAPVYCSRQCYKAHPLRTRVLKYSDADLLDHLRTLATKLGHTPTQKDLLKHSPPSHKIYYERFGSFSAACEAAGIKAYPGRGMAARRDRTPAVDGAKALRLAGLVVAQPTLRV